MPERRGGDASTSGGRAPELAAPAVVQGIERLERGLGRLFIAVGVFDGLHLGHLYLLRELGSAAAAHGARPVVITFDHHPDEILTGSAPPLLCDPEERLGLLAAAGVAVTIVQHFDVALRMTEFDAFIRRIAARIELAGFLMTPESAFGHDRRGTPAAVAELGRRMGYATVVVPPLDLDGRPVRSAEIRAAIAAGDLAAAAHLLGRRYAIVGSTGQAAAGDGAVPVRFEMPVALPPAGVYPVIVAAVPAGAAASGIAEIDDRGLVRLRITAGSAADPMPDGVRLRIVFG